MGLKRCICFLITCPSTEYVLATTNYKSHLACQLAHISAQIRAMIEQAREQHSEWNIPEGGLQSINSPINIMFGNKIDHDHFDKFRIYFEVQTPGKVG
jgi:hypothetical protein